MIGIGVLGAGRVVQNRYEEVFMNELRNARVTAVCDLIEERAKSCAIRLNTRATTDYESLLTDSEVEVILVATESGNHHKHARAALEAGKHVIVEKPPTMIPEETLNNEAFAQEKRLMYAPIFQNRLNPAMQILKKTFDQGRFGKLVLATIRLRWCRYQDYYEDGWHGTWNMDGGVINQQAIHHIDALQWICGPIKEVCAMQARILNDLEAEDTTTACLKFEDGALGVIEATTAARPEDFEASISVVGENGMAVIGGIALNQIDTWNFVESIPEDNSIPINYSQEVPNGYGLSHGPLIQDIIDRLAEGRIDPPITGTDAVPALQLVHAIYRSVENGGVVSMRDKPKSQKLGAC